MVGIPTIIIADHISIIIPTDPGDLYQSKIGGGVCIFTGNIDYLGLRDLIGL